MSSRILQLPLKSLIISFLCASFSSLVMAENGLSVEQRLGRLENLLKNQVLIEQTQRMEQIQQELSDIRGLVESQEHQLSLIKQRQRNLYQDIDRRLNDLEIQSGKPSSAGSAPVAVPSGSAASSGLSSSVPPPGAAAASSAGSAPAVAVAVPVGGDKNGKQVYGQAFNSLKEGKYQQAIIAFKNFQQSYPDSAYCANAQYWLGEAYSVTRDYKTALAEFQKVLAQYPQSNKVKDAMLKIGYTYYEMRDWVSAKTSLDAVISKYPGTTASRKAKERLQRMKREGR